MMIDKEHYFKPEPVVESRWNWKTTPPSGTFSPEVSWYGQHYIVGEPQSTHEAAFVIATTKANEVKEAMMKAAYPLFIGYKIAKE